ncbi:MAG: RtcB family protein [Deltaproteobacteria bacterium]|nr:RtcB family protein [Deltaproteobacteria bacterium]
MSSHQLIAVEGGVPVRAWVDGVPFEEGARKQVERTARLPFVHSHVAVMPDVHYGRGATVGTVIATSGAIVPAAVGVDIGCGMAAVRTSLTAAQLPDSLARVRAEIEEAVPVGRGDHERHPANKGRLPEIVSETWGELAAEYRQIVKDDPRVSHARPEVQVGSLGGGNHFIELCLDEAGAVWVMLHSGSRGAGNNIGSYFTDVARARIRERGIDLPDQDLAWLEEGSAAFRRYWRALDWAQRYARANREVMLARTLQAVRKAGLPRFAVDESAVNCHHNYVSREAHFDLDVLVTRKGAVRAGEGELGIIPGSMGAKSFIVRGKGNPMSFHSCSHGAGRAMSRGEATRSFTLAQHREATAGVECRKDEGVLDETPGAYKSIDAVMAAQADLVDIVYTLKQVVCVKG